MSFRKSLTVKNLKLNNRLVMPPMATEKSNEDGTISKDILNYYEEKSHGGFIGLIIIEHSYISNTGKVRDRQISISEDKYVDELSNLSAMIHDNGSKAVMQINHAGSATTKDIIGWQPVGPSSIAHPTKGTIPRELSINEIKEMVESFKKAAIRVKAAGFDGVEIHSAHGYLLNQFYSPLTNHRMDEYGGTLLNRIRLHLEIVREIRGAVGQDFPILLRLGACDYMDGGITLEDSLLAAQEFEKAGVDILDISGGFCGYNVAGLTGQGYFSPLTEGVKKVVSIPIILTGGITQPDAAAELLANDKADLIGVGRAILKDSNWAKKSMV